MGLIFCYYYLYSQWVQNEWVGHTLPCLDRKKDFKSVNESHFWTSKILTKTAAIFFWIYDFQITFWAYWNQLNNKYILIYKRNQSAVIFDWLFLVGVVFNLWIFYTFFNYYKMAYELEIMSLVNGQKNPVLSQHFCEVFLEPCDQMLLKKVSYFCKA